MMMLLTFIVTMLPPLILLTAVLALVACFLEKEVLPSYTMPEAEVWLPSSEWFRAASAEKEYLLQLFVFKYNLTEENFLYAWSCLGPGYSLKDYHTVFTMGRSAVIKRFGPLMPRDPFLLQVASQPKVPTVLDGDYVTGFTDGDGNFHIETDGKGNAAFVFKLSQADYNKGLLELFQGYFTVGNIVVENSKTGMYKMVIKTQAGILNHVIPHFDRFPLKSSKRLDYKAFREACLLYVSSTLPKDEVMARVIELKDSMNNNRSFDDKYEGAPATVLNAQWVRGFVEAEGCFYIGLGYTKSMTASMAIEHNLEVKQKGHHVRLLASLRDFFGQGKFNPSVNPHNLEQVKGLHRLNIILKVGNLESVFALFDEYPLLGDKQQDYLTFKQIYELKKNKVHLTAEGEYQVCMLKAGLNDSRLRWRPILKTWKGEIKPQRLKAFVSKRFPEINSKLQEALKNNNSH